MMTYECFQYIKTDILNVAGRLKMQNQKWRGAKCKTWKCGTNFIAWIEL